MNGTFQHFIFNIKLKFDVNFMCVNVVQNTSSEIRALPLVVESFSHPSLNYTEWCLFKNLIINS